MAVFRSISAMLGAAPRRSPDVLRAGPGSSAGSRRAGLLTFILYALFIGWPGWAGKGSPLSGWLVMPVSPLLTALEPGATPPPRPGALASPHTLVRRLSVGPDWRSRLAFPALVDGSAGRWALTRQPRSIVLGAGAALRSMLLALAAPEGWTAVPLIPEDGRGRWCGPP